MKWIKSGTVITSEGRTVTYAAEDTPYTVESRMRHIQNSKGGSWDHTSFFVLKDGREIAEKQLLRIAKEYAEALHGKDKGHY